SGQALTYLGDIAMKKEDTEKALVLLREATQMQGGDIRLAYMDLGSILLDQKRYPEALSALEQAVKLDPDQTDAHFRLGRVYKLMGNDAAADNEFAKVRELKQKEDDLARKTDKSPAP
ncbi:MAG: tetratricopeptide repeat protein, partial [Candidatus Acidiferrum sp.]